MTLQYNLSLSILHVMTEPFTVIPNSGLFVELKCRSNFFFLNDLKESESQNWIIEEQDTSNYEILYQCIDELNELNKAIILLYLDGNSHNEISEITGISKTNVGTRIGRIKEQIKNSVATKI